MRLAKRDYRWNAIDTIFWAKPELCFGSISRFYIIVRYLPRASSPVACLPQNSLRLFAAFAQKKKKTLIVHSPTHRHCKLRVLAFTSFVRGIEENNSESILARFCFYVCRQLSRCTEKDSARSTISLDWKVYIRAGGCHSFGHHRHRRNKINASSSLRILW